MLLEVTLAQDHEHLGPQGSKILVNDGYIVSIKRDKSGKAILFLDLSDLGTFTEVYIKEKYEQWYLLRLNA